MDISKDDSKMLKGAAILSLLMLHLFCRKADLPYTPLLWIGKTPLVYYLGLFGDICVAIFCFISGYAHYRQSSLGIKSRERYLHLLRFFITFWVIAGFFSILGLLTHNPTIPGNLREFLLNCLTVKTSYNGAWWYANTYLLFVLLQPLSYRFVKKCPLWLVLTFGFVFYTAGYGIRFWGWGAVDKPVLSWSIAHVGLLGTSYFPYVVGMLFCKKQIISMIRRALSSFRHVYIWEVIIFAGMIVMHGIVQSLYVAVITAIVTVCLLCACPMPKRLYAVLGYLGNHSANIWLTHMFFYLQLFDGLVFAAKYPIPIFLLLLLLSLASSYAIDLLCKPILKLVR